MERVDTVGVREAYRESRRRLLILDYEGTLAPREKSSDDPSTLDGLNETLFQLSNDTLNQVIIISDQTKEQLEDAFGYLPVIIAAERGGFFRTLKNQWNTLHKGTLSWKNPVTRSLNTLTQYYKGSFIDVKHFSVTWDYSALEAISTSELEQFHVAIRALARTHGLVVRENSHSIEFIAPGVNKASFVSGWVASHGDFDFILAMGDDPEDETLFETLGKEYFTIRVGRTQTSVRAKYYLDSQSEVMPFLKSLLSE